RAVVGVQVLDADASALSVACARARLALHRAGGWRARLQGGGLLGGRLHVRRLLLAVRRAIRVRARISITSVSAAPHARVTRRSCAWPMSAKICAGSEFIRCERSK